MSISNSKQHSTVTSVGLLYTAHKITSVSLVHSLTNWQGSKPGVPNFCLKQIKNIGAEYMGLALRLIRKIRPKNA